jgi:hypothetical protein
MDEVTGETSDDFSMNIAKVGRKYFETETQNFENCFTNFDSFR